MFCMISDSDQLPNNCRQLIPLHSRAMGEVLDAWCARGTLRGVDASQLSSALDQARLTYHAQAVRAMSEQAGKCCLHWLYINVDMANLAGTRAYLCCILQ